MHLNKLKSKAKNKPGTTLRITKKNFQDEELPHALCPTIRQRTKIRHAFAHNMPTDIKQFKTINSGEFLGNMISKLGKEALTKFAVPLTKDSLPELATKTTSSAIDKFERKISGRGA